MCSAPPISMLLMTWCQHLACIRPAAAGGGAMCACLALLVCTLLVAGTWCGVNWHRLCLSAARVLQCTTLCVRLLLVHQATATRRWSSNCCSVCHSSFAIPNDMMLHLPPHNGCPVPWGPNSLCRRTASCKPLTHMHGCTDKSSASSKQPLREGAACVVPSSCHSSRVCGSRGLACVHLL